MLAAGMNLAASEIFRFPLDPEIVFQCELAAAALSSERGDFSIL